MRKVLKLTLSGLAGVLIVLLGIQAVRLDSHLRRLQAELRATSKQAASAAAALASKGTPAAPAESLESTLHGLLSDVELARAERQALRQEIEAMRAERERASSAPTGTIVAAEWLGEIGGTYLFPQRERIERWEGGPKRSWGHEQAAGEPDTGRPGDIPSAWASKNPDGGEEWLQLDYDDLVDLQQINVVESHNPGAISKVAAVLPDGSETTVWEGTIDGSPQDELVTSEFHVDSNLRAQSVKVYVDTARVPGWNEIDAVQLVGRDGSKQWASASSASSSYADP
jgi:hypothetical protein